MEGGMYQAYLRGWGRGEKRVRSEQPLLAGDVHLVRHASRLIYDIRLSFPVRMIPNELSVTVCTYLSQQIVPVRRTMT